MFSYNLTSSPSFTIDTDIINNIFISISKHEKKVQKWLLNIVFMDNNSIKKLNKQYRKIDKSTDVLSFHYFDDFSDLNDEDIAWEVILSVEKIVSQWKEYWLWTEKEFYKLLIHSILHIIWYDHEVDWEYQVMQKLEDKIHKEVFEK